MAIIIDGYLEYWWLLMVIWVIDGYLDYWWLLRLLMVI